MGGPGSGNRKGRIAQVRFRSIRGRVFAREMHGAKHPFITKPHVELERYTPHSLRIEVGDSIIEVTIRLVY